MATIFPEIHNHLSKMIDEKYIIKKIQDMIGIVDKKKYMYNFLKYYVENYENMICVCFEGIWIYVEKKEKEEFTLYIITKEKIEKEHEIKNEYTNVKITKEENVEIYEIGIHNLNKNQILFLLYMIIETYDYFIPQPALFNKIFLDHYKDKYNIDEMKKTKIYIDKSILNLWQKLNNDDFKNEKLQYIEI